MIGAIRHLALTEAREALASGRAVEQWLCHRVENEERRIQWLRIHFDAREGYGLTLFDVIDEGNPDFLDMYEFQSIDPDEPFGNLEYFESWEAALGSAINRSGADPEKFVASGMIHDEYLDFVKKEGFWSV